MAIYRPPKARWPLATAIGVLGIVCGLVIGLTIGSKDPDPVEAAQSVRAALLSAAGSLEVASIEYQEAVDAGGVKSRLEYQGGLDALESSRSRYEEDARPALRLLAPAIAADIDVLYDRCAELMTAQADFTEVGPCLTELEDRLKGDA